MRIIIEGDAVREAAATDQDFIEVADEDWREFVAVSAKRTGLLRRFKDALAMKRAAEEAELVAARARVAELEARLGQQKPTPTLPPVPGHIRVTETTEEPVPIQTASQFTDEIRELRRYNIEKRRRAMAERRAR